MAMKLNWIDWRNSNMFLHYNTLGYTTLHYNTILLLQYNKTLKTVECPHQETGSRKRFVMGWWSCLVWLLSAHMLFQRRTHARPQLRANSKSLEPNPHSFHGRTSQCDVLIMRFEAMESLEMNEFRAEKMIEHNIPTLKWIVEPYAIN